MTQIDTAGLVKSGTLTMGDGLSALFDGSSVTRAYAEATTGRAWIKLDPPRKIDRVEVVSPSNGFDCSGSTSQVTLVLRADVTETEPSLTAQNHKGSITFTDTNATVTKTLACPDKSTEYTWVGVSMATGVFCGLAELRIYGVAEPEAIPDLPPVVVPGTLEERVYALEQRLSRPLIWHGNTGRGVELVQSVSINDGRAQDPYNFNVIYSLPLPDLYAGDVIQAFGILQFTNDTSIDWVMGATYITLGSSPSDPDISKRISEANGRNVGRVTTHHDVHPDFASYVVPENVRGLYLNYVGYAGRRNVTGSDRLTVNSPYGRLFATVTRAAIAG